MISPSLRKTIALKRLIEGWKYKYIADYYRVSIGAVQSCEKKYQETHPIWLKVRSVVYKLVN